VTKSGIFKNIIPSRALIAVCLGGYFEIMTMNWGSKVGGFTDVFCTRTSYLIIIGYRIPGRMKLIYL